MEMVGIDRREMVTMHLFMYFMDRGMSHVYPGSVHVHTLVMCMFVYPGRVHVTMWYLVEWSGLIGQPYLLSE